jgi:hypothetical protein
MAGWGSVRVALLAPLLVMKSMAITSRMLEQDAWERDRCSRNYPGGIEELAKEYQPRVEHTWVQEAPGNLSEKVASLEHVSGMETLQPP